MSTTDKTVPVTRLVRLGGNQAPTFSLDVPLTRLDRGAVILPLFCKAMRKTAWAEIRDKREAEAFAAQMKGLQPQPTPSTVEQADSSAPTEAAEPLTPATVMENALQALKENGFVANVERDARTNARAILQFATGWGLEDPLNEDSLVELENEFGGSLMASITAYDTAIWQGRLGN